MNLIELDLEGAGVYFCKYIAGFDPLALLKIDLDDLPIDPGFYGGRIGGGDRPQAGDNDIEIADLDLCAFDWLNPGWTTSRAPTFLTPLATTSACKSPGICGRGTITPCFIARCCSECEIATAGSKRQRTQQHEDFCSLAELAVEFFRDSHETDSVSVWLVW